MGEAYRGWKRIMEEGCEWEARVVTGPQQTDPGRAGDGDDEVLEFVCIDGSRQARRLAVPRDEVSRMDDAALRRAFRKALPIAGDHYGRPGKHMSDAR